MSSIVIVIICAAVSAGLTAIGTFVPGLQRIGGIVGFLWLAAALPILYFNNVSWQYVLVFYLLAAVINMAIARKGSGK